MALKGDRYEWFTDVSYFMNETATRGGVVCLSTTGSGSALDQSAALVTYSANPSGKQAIGMLMGDMVNYDLTRQHINVYKDEIQQGGKVCLLVKGWAVTNNIIGTPAVGDFAVLDNSGNMSSLTPTLFATANLSNKPKVGRFLSVKDEDGYAKVQVDL